MGARRRSGARSRRRAAPEGLSLSFLDAVTCGFGAVILLLVLAKIGEPGALEQARLDLDARVAELTEQLEEIRGEVPRLERRLTGRREQLSEERERVARLQGDLSRLRGELAASEQLSEVQDILSGRLLAAQQELPEEMERLQERAAYRPPPEAPVAGIPVDSEYVIFVIDTSGSMVSNAWPLMLRKMTEVLDAYPEVKGIQVMNDMGRYMFSGYAGRWIPDTPGRRRVILERLQTWTPFSNSSPVEGIRRAIQTFGRGDERVSIYVLGDEFTGGSIQEVVEAVDRFNPRDERGRPKVRIHAIGFPVIFSVDGISEQTGVRFATLMRILTERNGGSFVGLDTTRP